MILFDHVTYTYPEAPGPALRDISLHLPEAALTLLVGPSGAGKSTLLRCTNGLVPHFSGGSLQGSITVNGLNPVTATPEMMSRHVGFVFQDPEAQFVMNQVEDEIAFALENAAMPPQESGMPASTSGIENRQLSAAMRKSQAPDNTIAPPMQ